MSTDWILPSLPFCFAHVELHYFCLLWFIGFHYIHVQCNYEENKGHIWFRRFAFIIIHFPNFCYKITQLCSGLTILYMVHFIMLTLVHGTLRPGTSHLSDFPPWRLGCWNPCSRRCWGCLWQIWADAEKPSESSWWKW